MLKVFGIICLLGWMMIERPFDQTPTVQAATNTLTSTTRSVQEAAAESSQRANSLGAALQTPQDLTVPDKLRDFMKSTDKLSTLRSQLVADINEYHQLANGSLSRFDTEANGIKDPGVMRNMTLIRRKTAEDQAERERNATETIGLLDNVL